MSLCPNGDFRLSRYIDSDFGGLFGSENPESPVSVKSRTGLGLKTSNTNCPFNYGGRIHCPISSYESSNSNSRNCERNILKGFQEAIDPKCTAQSKIFSETQEEIYPSSNVYEDISACLQFAKMPKCLPIPITLVCLITGLEERYLH